MLLINKELIATVTLPGKLVTRFDCISSCMAFDSPDTDSGLSVLQIPSTAQLVYAEDKTRGVRSRFPVVRMRNVYILPGVPGLLEKAFLMLAKVGVVLVFVGLNPFWPFHTIA